MKPMFIELTLKRDGKKVMLPLASVMNGIFTTPEGWAFIDLPGDDYLVTLESYEDIRAILLDRGFLITAE